MKKSKKKEDSQPTSALLNNVINEYKVINLYFTSGDLLTLLNSSVIFTSEKTHSFILSVNLYKANTDDVDTVKQVFIMIFNSCFISDILEPTVRQYLFQIVEKKDIETMITFFCNCHLLLPKHSLKRMSLLYSCIIYVSQTYADTDLVRTTNVLRRFLEDSQRKSDVLLPVNAPPDKVEDFDKSESENIEIVPQYSDIFSSNQSNFVTSSNLSVEEIDGKVAYESVEEYFKIKFDVVKEKFLWCLKNSLILLKERTIPRSTMDLDQYQVKVHENVRIEDLYPFHDGLVHRIYFDVSKVNKNVRWDNLSRFVSGSVVCFTNNLFESVHFGSIVDSNYTDLPKGILLVKFNDDPLPDIMINNSFMMIETKIPNEMYQNILARLRILQPGHLPFTDQLVFANKIVTRPTFLKETDLEKLASFSDEDLDEFQMEAFRNTLKYNISLVKGAHDSGKTFTGLKIIKYFMSNLSKENFGPILVVCHNDESLDEFVLEGIRILGSENIVKIGGSNKTNYALKERDLATIKWDWVKKKQFPNYLFVRCGKNKRELDSFEESLSRKYAQILSFCKRWVPIDILRGFMSRDHVTYFQRNDFDFWMTDVDVMSKNILAKYSHSTQDSVMSFRNKFLEETVHKVLFETVIELLEHEDQDEEVRKKSVGKIIDPHTFRRTANMKLIICQATKTYFTEEEYKTLGSLDVDFGVRIKVYGYYLNKYQNILLKEYNQERKKYGELTKSRDDLISEEYFHIMKGVKVIVMTTTMSAKYGTVLDQIGCKIVIVEGAEKVLQSHVICSLSKECQQLILLGDDESTKNERKCPQSVHGSGVLFHSLIKAGYEPSILKRIHQRIGVGQCGMKLSCGHVCTWLRHTRTPIHNDYRCNMPCVKRCERNMHQCKLLCYMACECKENILIPLPCGHSKNMLCSNNEKEEQCFSTCEKVLRCGHSKNILCYVDEDEVDCTSKCEKVMKCGHTCLGVCGERCTCSQRMRRRLRCGHDIVYTCGKDISQEQCSKLCEKIISCGHKCQKLCYQPCICDEMVTNTLPCGHLKVAKCGYSLLGYKCLVSTEKILDCGHRCTYTCYTGLRRCNHVEYRILPCSHAVNVYCGINDKNIICKNICDRRLICKHLCRRPCHSGVCPPCEETHQSESSCLVM